MTDGDPSLGLFLSGELGRGRILGLVGIPVLGSLQSIVGMGLRKIFGWASGFRLVRVSIVFF